MPPKFLAVFSNLERIRRLSLSQPINRSMMFLRRYDFLSNLTSRAAQSSFALEGMTGLISRSSKYSSIHSARYPLSPPSANGQGMRSPSSSISSSSATRSSSHKAADSCVCPAVRWNCSGRPFESQRICIFVEKPPRERPNAWSPGSCGSLFFRPLPHTLPRELSCHRRTRVVGQWHQQPGNLLAGGGGSPKASHRRSIDRTTAKLSATARIRVGDLAMANPSSTPRKSHQVPSWDYCEAAPWQPALGKRQRSSPTVHLLKANGPSASPPWREMHVSQEDGRSSTMNK